MRSATHDGREERRGEDESITRRSGDGDFGTKSICADCGGGPAPHFTDSFWFSGGEVWKGRLLDQGSSGCTAAAVKPLYDAEIERGVNKSGRSVGRSVRDVARMRILHLAVQWSDPFDLNPFLSLQRLQWP